MESNLISPKLKSAIQEGLNLLNPLYEEQNKRKNHIDPEFVITDYLQYIRTKSYESTIESEAMLEALAAKIFKEDRSTISVKKMRSIGKHCTEVIFDINKQQQTFYIKYAWEGSIKEAIGLEFNNLLTLTPIRYLCSDDIIITEKVFDPLTPQLVYSIRDTHEYLYAYGAWEVFTTFLQLTDRKTSNIRWNGRRLANIDFGLVFYRGKLVFDSRFTITEESDSRQQGQIYALNWVLKKLKQQKVQSLLLNLDSKFCLALTCHRHPTPPLKAIISILNEDFFKQLHEK